MVPEGPHVSGQLIGVDRMTMVIVPNELRDAINKKLDEKSEGLIYPESDRELMYNQLLDYYDNHGVIPDFDLKQVGKP